MIADKKPNTLGILQARLSSSRLPGKVLKPILGKPMLSLHIERVLRSKKIDQLIVATSSESSDDPIEQMCRSINVGFFRGSLNDVLDRFYQAAKLKNPDYVVRLTGDCPLADPAVIDNTIEFTINGQFDYGSNTIDPTFPDGLDVEVMTFRTLKTNWEKSSSKFEREHVTPFIHAHHELFKIGSYQNDIDLSDLRWTVDNKEDFELVSKVYEQLYSAKPDFNTDDILKLLKRQPELATINSHFERNEGA